jgi:AcrR family transcriptional regulator
MRSGKPTGRPREFDSERALDAAMHVFWRKGYEGTSLADLTKAMKINRPSLYAAFGDKEELFRKVLARYSKGPTSYIRDALNEPTARAVAERLLFSTAEMLGDPKNPRGCLGIQGALACGEGSESVRRELISYRKAGEKIILDRFKRAKAEGDLPPNSDPSDLARYVMTIIRGMAVDAATGASREDLRCVARTALQAWPK